MGGLIFDHHSEILLGNDDTPSNTNKNYNVFIFLLSKYEINYLPKYITKILKSKNIIKVGCDITTDIMRIKQKYVIDIDGYVDTQYISKSIGILDYFLDSLSKRFLDMNKSKTDLLANWSKNITNKQMKYAAMDAYMSLMTYNRFSKISKMVNEIRRVVPI